jgi:hypothetical protein
MHQHAVGIGPADQVSVRAWVIVADKGDQVFDVDHALFAFSLQLALGFHQCAQQLFFRHVINHRAVNLAGHQQ